MSKYFKNKHSRPYSYLVNTEKMDVKRIDFDNFNLKQQLINDGYLMTGKNIYQRFKSGLLSENSFTVTSKNRTANIYYN